MPKVSIIMPVHNEPEHILRIAINSILNQTFTDFEFIIINDASENNAEEVILSYKDERIKYYKNETNLKVIKTLNKGLELASCEYIARMDADDISFKKRLEKQVAILDSNPRIGLVSAQCYIFPNKRLVTPPIEHNDIEKILKYCVNCIVHPQVMFRKSVIVDNNLKYSEKHLHIEDYKLWIDMCKVTQIYSIPEPLILHREWGESVSKKNEWEQYYNARMLVFESILEDAGIENEELKISYFHFLRNQTIKLKDYLEIEKAINVAKKKALEESSQYWFSYIYKTLEDFRESLHKKILW